MTTTHPDRNLALELVRVTEAAAMGAGRWIGRGEKESADQAAVDGMRAVLDTVEMTGLVVIGEGEKDEAPMLYHGAAVYMDKIACGPEAIHKVDIDAPPRQNIEAVAKAKGKKPTEVTVV